MPVRRETQFTVATARGRSRWWRGLAAVVSLVVLAGMSSMAKAAPRSAMLVVDANTSRVIASEAPDAPRYPASLTKVMTLYLVFEALRDRRVNLATRITLSERAASQPPSKLDLDAGDDIRLGDAIKALVTKSANDVALAIAEHLAGSEAAFARLMTQRARELGMSRTTFRNASGLPDDEQVTTARDMVTLGLRIQDDFPKEYRVFATSSFSYQGRNHRNHNTLLDRVEGVDGIKTGYTRASGFNLLSSARRGGRHVVAVVLGGASAGIRNARMRGLLVDGLRRASPVRVRPRVPLLVARPTPLRRPVARPAAIAAVPREVAPPLRNPAALAAAVAVSRRQVADTLPTHIQVGGVAVAIARVRPHDVLTQPNRVVDRPTVARPEPSSIAALVAQTTSDRAGMPSVEARHGDAARPARYAFAGRTFGLPAPVERAASGARLPSSLQAQAQRLGGAAPLVAGAGTVVLPRSEAASAGGVFIQIGAYSSADEANRRLTSARQRAAGLLDKAEPVAMLTQSGPRSLYRARFAGFDSAQASQTCNALRQRAIDCFVARGR